MITYRSKAREVALQMLFQYDFNPRVPRDILERFVKGRLRDPKMQAFCLALYDGVLKNKSTIDRRISASADNWSLTRMAGVDRNVLRIGALELLHTPETPANVAFDEAVNLAKRFGSADSPRFVNGVLDRLKQMAAAPA